jgi:hypothetical protein
MGEYKNKLSCMSREKPTQYIVAEMYEMQGGLRGGLTVSKIGFGRASPVKLRALINIFQDIFIVVPY